MPSAKIPNGSGGWIKIPTVKGDAGTITSVVLTSGNHAAGTTDTYTITYNDNSTTTFTVYNGADGSGAGDMVKSVYDVGNKNADAFNVDNHASGTTNKVYTAIEQTKLSNIATEATKNSADATLLDRANHTGTQLKATISDFPTEMTPSSHTHGNITNDGKIGSTADLPIFAGAAGALVAKSIADAKTLLGIVTGVQIETGSYTGTGTYGSGNPNSLTFGFAPKLIIIMQSNSAANNTGIIVVGASSGICYNMVSQLTVSISGNTVSWYSTNGAQYQLNNASAYKYIALG